MFRALRVLGGRTLILRGYASEEEPAGKEIQIAASSLRVDAIAAAGLDISRKWALNDACLIRDDLYNLFVSERSGNPAWKVV